MKMLKRFTMAALTATLLLVPVACDSNDQKTAANLITVVGNSVTALVQIEGLSVDAVKLKADFSAASIAVLNWKQGTPAQDVVQALNILDDDLDLIPALTDAQKALIVLGIGTVDEIITLIDPSAQAPVGTPVAAQVAFTWTSYQVTASRRHHRKLARPVWNARDFKKQCKELAKQYPELAKPCSK